MKMRFLSILVVLSFSWSPETVSGQNTDVENPTNRDLDPTVLFPGSCPGEYCLTPPGKFEPITPDLDPVRLFPPSCPGPSCPAPPDRIPDPLGCYPDCDQPNPVDPTLEALDQIAEDIKTEVTISDDTVIGIDPKLPGIFIRDGPKVEPDEVPEPPVPDIDSLKKGPKPEALAESTTAKSPQQCAVLDSVSSGGAGSVGTDGRVCGLGCGQQKSLYEGVLYRCQEFGECAEDLLQFYRKGLSACCTGGLPLCP